jgi:hypothetical protein
MVIDHVGYLYILLSILHDFGAWLDFSFGAECDGVMRYSRDAQTLFRGCVPCKCKSRATDVCPPLICIISCDCDKAGRRTRDHGRRRLNDSGTWISFICEIIAYIAKAKSLFASFPT